MKKAKLLILVFLFSAPLCSQVSSGQQLSKKIDNLITRNYQSIAPGCVVLVSEEDKLVYEKGFGKANIELNDPLRPEMLFRIGSITKQYTAIAILQLIEQGRILLQDSLQKFIEGFPHKGYTITIENLLTHTSGIVDYEVLDFHVPNAIRIDFPPKQIIDSLAVLPLAFIPGTQYRYSNSNYFLLGFILEKVTGKAYKTYMKENVFIPLGLSETCYDSPAEIIKNRVTGYTKGSTGYENAGYLSMNQVFSAGALLASARDLFKWHQALYTYKVVKKETLDKAVAPFQFSDGKLSEYGYGWFIKEFRGKKLIGHGGAIDGFRSMEAYLPEQDIFIAALFNSDNDDFFPLFENIISLVVGKSLVASYEDLKIDTSVLDIYTGTYKWTEDTTGHIVIYREGNRLYADLSNKTGMHMPLHAQSPTLFYLPVVRRIATTIEFIPENGKVNRLWWTQEKKQEARRSE